METVRATLIVSNDNSAEQLWEITQDSVMIGRDAKTCHIVLPHPEVSRQHARLEFENGAWHLTDLNSRNGTRVNGRLVMGRVTLCDRDEIEIALKVKLLFQLGDATLPVLGDDMRSIPRREIAPPVGLTLDRAARRIFINGKELLPPLSPQQYLLLVTLMDANGAVVSRDKLLDLLRGPDYDGYPQALDALVRRLRERLREIDTEHEYVLTMRGHGLRFVNRS
ncbi:MAG: FHA domain-containing protein [Anaerolineae bacterium]|nr:FHA domain-containing protein [Thermoflexales bacterium]MDW8396884.1 FHA domain-containing protein [Anaerolineae bacterium]